MTGWDDGDTGLARQGAVATADGADEDAAAAAKEARQQAERDRLSAWMVAQVERQADELEARARAGRLPPVRRPRANGASTVYTLRLGHDEREALEARADALGMPPSVLARNLIRRGLTRSDARLDATLNQLDDLAVQLRTLLAR